MAKKRDYYEVLDLHKGATEKEIKAAFRKKAMEFHPDKNKGNKTAEEKFKEVNEAYAVLSDKKKKDLYDKFGHAGVDPNSGFSGDGGFSGFQNVDFDFDIGDLFGSFFGGERSSKKRRNAPRRGADLQHDVHISFEEAAFGVVKEVNIIKDVECVACKGTGAKNANAKETCKTCGGSGKVQREQNTPFGRFANVGICPDCHGTGEIIKEKCPNCKGNGIVRKNFKVKVNIPAGVRDDQIIPLKGQGEPGRKGGPAGDLYIILSVSPHKYFQRDGQNLYLEYPITFMQAALGDTIIVPTLKEKVKLKIPPGTKTGKDFRIRGKGIKYVRSNKYGNLYIRIKLETPQSLSANDKKALKELLENENDKAYPVIKKFKEKIGT
jgi:molecular chaperone DnaJ